MFLTTIEHFRSLDPKDIHDLAIRAYEAYNLLRRSHLTRGGAAQDSREGEMDVAAHTNEMPQIESEKVIKVTIPPQHRWPI